jgi:Flp pilus assembly pilin Flp
VTRILYWCELYSGNQKGQGVTEFLFLISLIALAAIITLNALGLQLTEYFYSIINILKGGN